MTRRARPRRGRRSRPEHTSLSLDELNKMSELAATGDAIGADVRLIRPSQARKSYVCPGCHQDIAPATGHVVVVPRGAPDLRRHWHKPCWLMRERRRPGN